MDGISRSDFADAVAGTIRSVRQFYREVDRLIAGLKEALGDGDDALVAVGGSTGKASGPRQQGRMVLRDEYNILFEAADDENDPQADDGDDEDEENDDADVDASPERRSAPAQLAPDQALLALRVSLWTHRNQPGFEPAVQYAVLGDWWVSGKRPPDSFLVRRYMLRRIPWVLADEPDRSKRVMTAARAAGKGKRKDDRRISCRALGGVHTISLYELDEPKAPDDLAVKMKDHWHEVTGGK